MYRNISSSQEIIIEKNNCTSVDVNSTSIFNVTSLL